MNVYDFCYLLSDDAEEVAVWDYRTEAEIFCGPARDLMLEDFRECEVLGIDIDKFSERPAVIILNIETEEEVDEW